VLCIRYDLRLGPLYVADKKESQSEVVGRHTGSYRQRGADFLIPSAATNLHNPASMDGIFRLSTHKEDQLVIGGLRAELVSPHHCRSR
jgi:hypothetical protein